MGPADGPWAPLPSSLSEPPAALAAPERSRAANAIVMEILRMSRFRLSNQLNVLNESRKYFIGSSAPNTPPGKDPSSSW